MTAPLYGVAVPGLFDAGGFFALNAVWMLALVALYAASLAGERKNAVWFWAWGLTLLLAVVAWPLLQVWYPEMLWPMLSYEDGRLSQGLFYAGIFVACSVVFRLGLLAYMFSRPMAGYEGNEVDLQQLDVQRARTVREIAASRGRVRASFLFGRADEGLVARFYGAMRAMVAQRRARWYVIASLLCLVLMWFVIYPLVMSSPALAQKRDRERMYEQGNQDGLLSTPALYAAYRVLKPLTKNDRLQGMSLAEAERYLGLNKLEEGLRATLRDESALESLSSEDIHQSRRRFLTFSDGKRRLVLYLRMAADEKRINFAELEEEGWNARIDEMRRRRSGDWRSQTISR